MSSALQAEFQGPPTPESFAEAEHKDKSKQVVSLIDRFGSLSVLIRQAGVAAVVLSMGLFLFDGLTVENDTMRFYSMLMLTGLLSAGGIALAFVLKEQRGARSFFGLALLSVPVNFAVLGALFYSVFQFDSMLGVYPSLLEWKLTDIATLGKTMLIAFATLVPVTVFSVSVMARKQRFWLGAALLLSSSFLLIPVRDASWIAPIVAVMVCLLILLIKGQSKNAVSLKTTGGRVVQALLFLPPAIMLFRSFWLYGVTASAGAVVALTLFICLRYLSTQLDADGKLVNGIHCLSSIAALVAGVFTFSAAIPVLGASVAIVLFCTVFGALMLDLENRIHNADLAEITGIAASLLIAMAIVYHQFMYSGLMVVLVGIFLVGLMLISAMWQQAKEKLAIGGGTLVAVLLLNLSTLITYFVQAGWLGFATMGAAAILTASVLDRFGPLLSLKLRRRLPSSD